MTFVINVRANDVNWDYNPYAYQYDMTVYIALSSIDGNNIEDASDYEIAAFCNQECRGIAETKTSGEHEYVYLRVRSNKENGETISFKVKNNNSGIISSVVETLEFKSQQTIGYPSNPFLLNAVNQYTITFNTDGGSEIAAITQDFNSVVTPPANPVRKGYTFIGWDTEIPATMPAEDITIKALWRMNLEIDIDEALYATFIAPFDVELPVGITAYTIDGIDADGVTLVMTSIPTIPANTPVVLHSEAPISAMVSGIGEAEQQTYTVGLLTGTYSNLEISDCYVLQNQVKKGVAFYAVSDGKTAVVPANHAFLTVPEGTNAKELHFCIDTTAVMSVNALVTGTKTVYSANGVKQNSFQKGINVIKTENGEIVKILVK